MKIENLCRMPVVSISPKATVQQAAVLMNARGTGSLIVTDESGFPIGILTDRDSLLKVAMNGLQPDCCSVESVMESHFLRVSPDTNVFDVTELMSKEKVRRLVVINNEGKFFGIVSTTDILEILIRHVVLLTENQRLVPGNHFSHDYTQMA